MSQGSVPNSPATSGGQAYVFERGYRRYSGYREGRRRGIISLVTHSLKRALGFKRKWTSKIVPALLYMAAFLPVLGILSIQALIGTDVITFTFETAFSGLSMILLIFAAAAAPEMLCDDRRERVLQLYFSRGITRVDYVSSKLIALGIILASVSLLPGALLYLGNAFLADSPFSELVNSSGELLAVVIVSVLLSIYFASVALTVASLTTRKGIASAIIIGGFMMISGITESLFYSIQADWSRYFALAQPITVADGIILWAFGEDPNPGTVLDQASLAGPYFLIPIAIAAIAAALILYRTYLTEE